MKSRPAARDFEIPELLAGARRHLQEGALTKAVDLVTQALQVDPDHADAKRVHEELLEAQASRERDGERARQVERALGHARDSLQAEALESALRGADEVLAYEPENQEAEAIRQEAQQALREREDRAAKDRRARDTVELAHEDFAGGQRERALELLEAFRPTHPLISEALTQLRQEQQKAERQELLAKQVEEARGMLAAQRYDAALQTLAKLHDEGFTTPEIDDLRQQAERGLGEAQARAARMLQMRSLQSEASAALTDGELTTAKQRVDAALELEPDDRAVQELRAQVDAALETRRLEEARQRLADQLKPARQMLAGRRYDEVLAALAQLRRDGFESPEIDRLQQEAEQAAAKAQVERHTQQRLGEAEAVLTREELTSAEQQIDATLALEPDDQRAQVAEALDVQRAADVRQQQLAQQLDKARQLLTARHYEEVLDALTQLRDHGFSAPEIDDLQQEAEQAAAQAQVERQIDADATHAVQQAGQLFERREREAALSLLENFSPPHELVTRTLDRLRVRARRQERVEHWGVVAGRVVRGRRFRTGVVALCAVLVIVAGTVLFLQRQTVEEPLPPPLTPTFVMSIDAVPWARVTIVPASPESELDPVEGITPMSLALPAGQYRVEYARDGALKPHVRMFEVQPGQSNTLRLEMPDFDVDSIVGQLLENR